MKLLTIGTLHQKPVTLTAKNGNNYTKGILKEIKGDVTNWVNLTAFDSNGVTLAGLNAGDSLSVSGEATVALYTPDGKQPRVSTSVTVEQIIALTRKKANAVKPAPAVIQENKPAHANTPKKQQIISNETLETAKDERAKKNAPATGACQQCGKQLVDGLCSVCPF